MHTHVLTLVIALTGCSLLHAADDDKAAERKKEIETQKKQADELWKGLLTGTQTAAHKELPSFLLYGTVDENALETIGKGMEKGLATLKKTAALKPDALLWPGKVVVHVCKERPEFRSLYLKLKKETADKDEMGMYVHDRDATLIVLGPTEMKKHPLEVEGVIQLAAATLTKKAGRLPDWFVMGFSRANGYRHAPNQFTTERQKARLYIRQGKTAKDVWTANLSAEEAPILTASFIDFLMNSPQMSRSWPEVLDNMGEETPFKDALNAAKLMEDRVDAAWRNWAGR